MNDRGATNSVKIIVAFTFLLMVVINVLANALPINGQTTGQVSNAYPNLFAPAGLTFAIWGLIYLLLAAYTIYQLGYFNGSKSDRKLLDKVGIYFSISSLANGAWIYSWHYRLIPVSLGLMAIILCCLIYIVQLLSCELFDRRETFFVKTPFSIYLGWITVASIANVTVLLVSIGWSRFGLSETLWTVIILFAGCAIGISAMLKNRDSAYGAVLLWAYFGILYRHISQNGFAAQYTLIVSVVVLCLALFLIAEMYIIKNK